ncbi:MAG: hypothetical protein Q8O83_01855 [bacterium]|nr:hypothetical protein [bacterium]
MLLKDDLGERVYAVLVMSTFLALTIFFGLIGMGSFYLGRLPGGVIWSFISLGFFVGSYLVYWAAFIYKKGEQGYV